MSIQIDGTFIVTDVSSLGDHLTVHIQGADGRLCVSNRLQPKLTDSSSNTHIGLANLSKRYRLLFGRDITIEETEKLFKVTLPLI